MNILFLGKSVSYSHFEWNILELEAAFRHFDSSLSLQMFAYGPGVDIEKHPLHESIHRRIIKIPTQASLDDYLTFSVELRDLFFDDYQRMGLDLVFCLDWESSFAMRKTSPVITYLSPMATSDLLMRLDSLSFDEKRIFREVFNHSKITLFFQKRLCKVIAETVTHLAVVMDIKSFINKDKVQSPLTESFLKICRLFMSKRLDFFIASQTGQSKQSRQRQQKSVLLRKSSLREIYEYSAEMLPPESTLIIECVPLELEIFKRRGHDVVPHVLKKGFNNYLSFPVEYIPAQNETVKNLVCLMGPEFFPDFNATFQEFLRVCQENIVLGFTIGKKTQGQYWTFYSAEEAFQLFENNTHVIINSRKDFYITDQAGEKQHYTVLQFQKQGDANV